MNDEEDVEHESNDESSDNEGGNIYSDGNDSFD